jgi:hypothetical protein
MRITALLPLCVVLAVPPASSVRATDRLVSLSVTVTNHRAAAVTSLGFSPDSESKAPANQLKRPLANGKSVKLTVRAPKDACSFAVVGAYSDGEVISGAGINLCDDHVLVLVD